MLTERSRLWLAVANVVVGELCAMIGAGLLGISAHRWLLTGHADGASLAINACCLVAGIVCIRLGWRRVVDAVTDWVMGGRAQ